MRPQFTWRDSPQPASTLPLHAWTAKKKPRGGGDHSSENTQLSRLGALLEAQNRVGFGAAKIAQQQPRPRWGPRRGLTPRRGTVGVTFRGCAEANTHGGGIHKTTLEFFQVRGGGGDGVGPPGKLYRGANSSHPRPAATSGYLRAQAWRSVMYRTSPEAWLTRCSHCRMIAASNGALTR